MVFQLVGKPNTIYNFLIQENMKNFYSFNFLFNTIVVTLLLFSTSAFSQTYTDPDDLADAVNAASATGGTFIVADSDTAYSDFEATFEVMATAENPIIIKAETVGGVTLTGESHFTFKKSAYITLEGFVFDCSDTGTLVKLEGCNNIRITRNVFEQAQTDSAKWVYIGGVWDDTDYPFINPSHHNRIDHNTFQNKTLPGHYITVDGNTDEDTDVAYQSQYDRIDHNHFKNNSPRATNEQESIRIGWSEMSQSSGYTTVEFNLFEDCDGDPEIVSVKSCDNTIRHNTFKNSYGTLSLRHGNRNRVEGNYFFGNGKAQGVSPDGADLYTGGIRIYGTDHVIINNYFEGLNGTRWDAPITLTLGDAIDGQSTSWSKHFRAERVLIAYNTLVNNDHGIEIGYDNNDSYGKDLADITIANNLITGSKNALVEIVDTDNDQGSNITWINNLMEPTGTAVTLSGATSTSFNGTSDAIDENPNLVLNTDITYDNTTGVWKTSVSSPLYSNGASETVSEDIEGQARPTTSNPGADHFSMESERFAPLTTSDVGPLAVGDGTVLESLAVTTINEFVAVGGTETSTITSNVSWTVTDDSDWVTVTPLSGTDNGSISITATENTTYSARTGIVTVTGESLSRTINISQAGAVRTNLINVGTGLPTDKVTVHSFSKENSSKSPPELAIHSLDKDVDTEWTADDQNDDGEFVIYDLGSNYNLDFIQFSTTNKSDPFGFQIWVSTTGTEDSDFTMILPTTGDLLLTATGTTDFNEYEVGAEAIYVKIVGFGRFDSTGVTKKSDWIAVTEIEFYGDAVSLSVDDNEFNKNISIYPVPAKDHLNIKMLSDKGIDNVKIFNIEGKLMMEKRIDNSQLEFSINIEALPSGTYILNLSGDYGVNGSKMIIVTE